MRVVCLAFSISMIATSCTSSNAQEQKDNHPASSLDPASAYPGTNRAIKIIQRSKGVFLYEYKLADPFKKIDPYIDYHSYRRLTHAGLIGDIKSLLDENKDFNPEYKKRCLPHWQYGLEFRESSKKRRMILFSFQCSTMMIFEEKVYRDFSPQNARLYALLKYQINDRTSEVLK